MNEVGLREGGLPPLVVLEGFVFNPRRTYLKRAEECLDLPRVISLRVLDREKHNGGFLVYVSGQAFTPLAR